MTFAPVREAQRLWEQTSPQLTLDFDDYTSLPVSTTPLAARGIPLTASVAPAATNNNALARSTYPGSASEGSQETS